MANAAIEGSRQTFRLSQPYLCHVTQPKLHEQLLEWGLDLSVGQIDALPTSGQNVFSAEKTSLLKTGPPLLPPVTTC